MKRALLILSVVAALVGSASTAHASIDVSAEGLLAPGGYLAGPTVEFVTKRLGMTASLNAMGYSFYDGEGYSEWGGGLLVNLRTRYYPTVETQRLWIAAGMALGTVSWTWEIYDSGTTTSEDGSAFVFAPNFGVGYKFVTGNDRVVIDPQIMFGVITGGDEGNPFFGGAGLSVGLRF